MVANTPTINGYSATSLLYTPRLDITKELVPSLWGKTRNAIEFIDGGWAREVGEKWRAARKAGTEFKFWEAYHDANLEREILRTGVSDATAAAKQYVENNPDLVKDFANKTKKAQDAIIKKLANDNSVKTAARQACGKNGYILSLANKNGKVANGLAKVCKEAAEKAIPQKAGFFGKIFGGIKKIPGLKFLGRHFGPLMMLGVTAYSMYQEFKLGGGALGAGKELAKGLIGQAAYIGGTLIGAALLGISGGWLLIPGLIASFAGTWIGNKIFGKSTSEKIAEAQEKQKEQLAANNGSYQLNPVGTYGPGTPREQVYNNNGNYNADANLRAAEAVFRHSQNMFNQRYYPI